MYIVALGHSTVLHECNQNEPIGIRSFWVEKRRCVWSVPEKNHATGICKTGVGRATLANVWFAINEQRYAPRQISMGRMPEPVSYMDNVSCFASSVFRIKKGKLSSRFCASNQMFIFLFLTKRLFNIMEVLITTILCNNKIPYKYYRYAQPENKKKKKVPLR
jgi:hypothetical protein